MKVSEFLKEKVIPLTHDDGSPQFAIDLERVIEAIKMARNGEREKAIEAHRHACPIRIYRMFCPHVRQREKRTSEGCPMDCDYMTRFKEEIDSIR